MLRASHIFCRRLLLASIVCAVAANAVCHASELSELGFDLNARVARLEAEVLRLHGPSPSAAIDDGIAGSGSFATKSQAGQRTRQPCLDCLSSAQPSPERQFPTIQVGGMFQADWGWFHQSALNMATVGDIQDGADFRRARLNAHGDVWDNVGYMIEFDFAFPGRPSFMDVYMDIRDSALGTIRFGQWRQPFGMDGQTSVKELTFLERALPFAFLPFRQIGVGMFQQSTDESMTWAMTAFRFPTDVFGGNVGDDGGYGTSMRGTLLPLCSGHESRLVHVGLAYVFANPANNQVRYATPPEFFVAQNGALVPSFVPSTIPLFVDTGPIPANNFHLFGVEGGLLRGRFHLQSEAMFAVVNQIAGPTVLFSGVYAQTGYFLTGEVRPYNRRVGVFGQAKPLRDFGRSGKGAWELATRWSYLDLNDGNITGGRLNDLTLGLNWYLNEHTKFQLNYIHAFLDSPTFGNSNADIFAWRGQIDF